MKKYLIFGMAGCMLLAGSDWLMIYGDTSFEGNLAWLTTGAAQIPAGEALMLLPFLVLVFWIIRKKSVFSPWMAWNNPLVLYLLLKVLTGFLPDRPFRLAFVNGLMSEAMFLWFLIFLITAKRKELP